MRCEWQAYLNLLPVWLRKEVDKYGRDTLLEVRLRKDMFPQLITRSGVLWIERSINKEDISFCINAASQYSPWSIKSVNSGYITAPGGHRIGICGTSVTTDRCELGFQTIMSLCIRVARDFPGVSKDAETLSRSVLIIGKPGSGKTTFLRDLVRTRSETESIAVVDEKAEIFPISHEKYCFSIGKQNDILTGVPKGSGIEMVLKNMTPQTIAVDEITSQEDCEALIHAGWCGVDLFATAHARDLQDLKRRRVYRPLVQSGLFETVVIMHPDKTWHTERIIS